MTRPCHYNCTGTACACVEQSRRHCLTTCIIGDCQNDAITAGYNLCSYHAAHSIEAGTLLAEVRRRIEAMAPLGDELTIECLNSVEDSVLLVLEHLRVDEISLQGLRSYDEIYLLPPVEQEPLRPIAPPNRPSAPTDDGAQSSSVLAACLRPGCTRVPNARGLCPVCDSDYFEGRGFSTADLYQWAVGRIENLRAFEANLGVEERTFLGQLTTMIQGPVGIIGGYTSGLRQPDLVLLSCVNPGCRQAATSNGLCMGCTRQYISGNVPTPEVNHWIVVRISTMRANETRWTVAEQSFYTQLTRLVGFPHHTPALLTCVRPGCPNQAGANGLCGSCPVDSNLPHWLSTRVASMAVLEDSLTQRDRNHLNGWRSLLRVWDMAGSTPTVSGLSPAGTIFLNGVREEAGRRMQAEMQARTTQNGLTLGPQTISDLQSWRVEHPTEEQIQAVYGLTGTPGFLICVRPDCFEPMGNSLNGLCPSCQPVHSLNTRERSGLRGWIDARCMDMATCGRSLSEQERRVFDTLQLSASYLEPQGAVGAVGAVGVTGNPSTPGRQPGVGETLSLCLYPLCALGAGPNGFCGIHRAVSQAQHLMLIDARLAFIADLLQQDNDSSMNGRPNWLIQYWAQVRARISENGSVRGAPTDFRRYETAPIRSALGLLEDFNEPALRQLYEHLRRRFSKPILPADAKVNQRHLDLGPE